MYVNKKVLPKTEVLPGIFFSKIFGKEDIWLCLYPL